MRGGVVSSNGVQKNGKGEIWAVHDSIGYIFPQGGDLEISHKAQSGSWYRIKPFSK
jgi:chondroitin AC lyase